MLVGNFLQPGADPMTQQSALSRAMLALAVAVTLAGAAVAQPASAAKTTNSAKSVKPQATAPAAAHALAVPFHSDDYEVALAEARARNVPLFVDAWATWCHTCRSMKAYVLTDASLTPRADEFVWFLMDVENPKNAALKSRIPAEALPTFFVVNPKDESIARRWVGGMTIVQLQGFLDDGKLAVAATNGAPQGRAETPLAKADRLYGAADYKAAADAYLSAAPAPSDPNFARVAEATMYALSTSQRNAEGVAFADATLPSLVGTTSGASLTVGALGCALALPEDTPGRAETIAKFEALTKEYLANPNIAMADDDRSGMFGTLLDARTDAKDAAGAKAAAQAWATFLEGAASRATTPDARAVFDSHRLAAYIELGTPEKAIPMLQASEKALPNDYNPPARLAIAYNAMKQWDDALAATDRALAKAYGPRALRSYQARSDAFAGKGDMAAARKTLDDAIAYASALPNPPTNSIAALTKKRDAIVVDGPTANSGGK